MCCCRWHADHVAARLLVTYSGPGTWYITNQHVKRKQTLVDGSLAVSVGSVDERHAVQAQPGDVLVMKGHGWPGCYGLGCVHRSPVVSDEPLDSAASDDDAGMGEGQGLCGTTEGSVSQGLRLLLTIDDALLGDHHHQHGHHHGQGCSCAS